MICQPSRSHGMSPRCEKKSISVMDNRWFEEEEVGNFEISNNICVNKWLMIVSTGFWEPWHSAIIKYAPDRQMSSNRSPLKQHASIPSYSHRGHVPHVLWLRNVSESIREPASRLHKFILLVKIVIHIDMLVKIVIHIDSVDSHYD